MILTFIVNNISAAKNALGQTWAFFVFSIFGILYFMDTNQEPREDRWHYLDDRNEKHIENYIEWKYFNFVQKDLEGYIIYYILDPEKKMNFGGGRLLVRILKDGKTYGLVKKFEMDQVELDTISASLRMGGASIKEKDSYHYELNCKSEDVDWSLTYKQKAPSIESFRNFHNGLLYWEKLNWLVKMPRAEVEGDVRIGQETFHIDGLGYSDTNWGEVIPFFSRHEWGQYNEKDFSLVFGILRELDKVKSTYFYFIIGEHLIKLENVEYKVEHLEWEKDKTVGEKIPSHSVFYVKNEEYEIKFSTKLISYDSPGLKIHSLLPKIFVSEQIVEYEGVVKKNGVVLRSFKGHGFQEWSGKTWSEVPLSF